MVNDHNRNSNAYTCRCCGYSLRDIRDKSRTEEISIQAKTEMKIYLPKTEVSKYMLEKPYRRKLVEDFTFVYEGRVYTIKRGFWFDGASIPRFLWRAVGSPMTGKYYLAALVHDMLYATHYFPREVADEVFLNIMEHCGVGMIKRHAMYRGVRMGGWVGWNKPTEEIVKANKYLIVNGINNG